jgi:serine/threonine protein kinase
MVEPLEETRTELIFATEPVLSSLDLSIPRGSRHTPLVELDEIEVRPLLLMQNSINKSNSTQIQKGILQLCKGLSFLHTSARLIHTNLKPECVIINDVVSVPVPDGQPCGYILVAAFRVIGKFLVLALPSPSLVRMDLRPVGNFLVLMVECRHIFSVLLIISVRAVLLSQHVPSDSFSTDRQLRNTHWMKSLSLHQTCIPSVV